LVRANQSALGLILETLMIDPWWRPLAFKGCRRELAGEIETVGQTAVETEDKTGQLQSLLKFS
jgi:hypothetical protein